MPDVPTKLTEIPRYKRISKDVKTVVLAKILQELQSAPTLQTLLQNVYRMVREEFDSVGVLVSIFDSYREELVYYSQAMPPNPRVTRRNSDRAWPAGLALRSHRSALRISTTSPSLP
jgi:hypothetical protein